MVRDTKRAASMDRRTVVSVTVLVTLAFFTGVATAHDPPADRFDAPLPLSLLYAGAAATVAGTAVILVVAGDRLGSVPTRPVLRVPKRIGDTMCTVAGVAFLACFALVLLGGVFGPKDAGINVGTVLFWGLWLKGVAVLAALVGDPWRVLSPWETVFDGL